MAYDKWIVSDTHFGHANIIKFTKPDGSPIRPGFTPEPTRAFVRFKDIGHHDEMLIQRWNNRIGLYDKVYHLGDFGKPLSVAARLHGKKRLILGNHDDIHDASDLAKYFERITVIRDLRNEFAYPVIFSHYPLHADERKPAPRKLCIHGHIHEKMITRNGGQPDPWYINVCVEHTNHAPMSFDELGKIVKARGDVLKDLGEIE